MEKIFVNTENFKTNEPHEFALNLSERLGLNSSNNINMFEYKHVLV